MQSVIEAHPLDEEMRIMRSQLEAAGTHMLFSALATGRKTAPAPTSQPSTQCVPLGLISQEPPNPVLPGFCPV